MIALLAAVVGGVAALAVIFGGGDRQAVIPATEGVAVSSSSRAPTVLGFGQVHTFPSGVSVVADAPGWFDIASDVEGMPDQAVRVTATVVNGSALPLDMAAVAIGGTFAGQPAELANLDHDQDQLVTRGGTLLPGQSQRFDLVYEPASGNLTLEVRPPGSIESVFIAGPVPPAPPPAVAVEPEAEPEPKPEPTESTSEPDCEALSARYEHLANAELFPLLEDEGCGDWLDAGQMAADETSEPGTCGARSCTLPDGQSMLVCENDPTASRWCTETWTDQFGTWH